MEHIQLYAESSVVYTERSKTDQEGKGESILIPYDQHSFTCPVQAYLNWIEAAQIDSGPLFHSITKMNKPLSQRLCEDSISTIVKKYIDLAGLDSSEYRAHSLRAGFISSATSNSNCHSYAYYSTSSTNKYWIDDPTPYLNDGSYKQYTGSLANLPKGVVASYSITVHSAKVEPVNGANTLSSLAAISKWGEGPVMSHTLSDSPYSNQIKLWYR